MLGFVIINALLPQTIIATPAVLSIIWAGSGFRYVGYGLGIWFLIETPSLMQSALQVSQVERGLTTGALDYITRYVRVGHIAARIMLPRGFELLISPVGSVGLVFGSVIGMFLSFALLLKRRWSRRLARVRREVHR